MPQFLVKAALFYFSPEASFILIYPVSDAILNWYRYQVFIKP